MRPAVNTANRTIRYVAAMRRLWLPLVLLALAAGLTACGSDDAEDTAAATTTSTSEATSTTAPISSTTVAAVTTSTPMPVPANTIPPAQCNPKTDPAKPALPAETFYKAWRIGDKACAQKLGIPAAVDALFKLKPNGPEWDFQGCTAGQQPDTGDCAFTYEGGATHFAIAYSAANGWSITKVSQVAD